MELTIGKWYGKVTIQNINMSGGWGPEGFLGIHETTKDIWQIELDVKFLHPFDDPLVVEECKKAGIPIDNLKNLKNMMPAALNINGTAAINGFSEYTHETKKYCEECRGKDVTRKKEFPKVIIQVSGNIDLAANKINFRFGDLPKEYNVGLSYWFSSNNVKLTEPNKIVFSYKHFEENAVDQNMTGELYPTEERLRKSISKEGLEFIAKLEGCVKNAQGLHIIYNDQAGRPTIGYGHLIKDNEKSQFQNGITEEQAINLLKSDIARFEDIVNNSLKENVTESQFDALVAFAYNIGEYGFKDSTALKMINNKSDIFTIERFWKDWNKITLKGLKQVSDGLVNRRNLEWLLYLQGRY